MSKQWVRQQVQQNELASVMDEAQLWVRMHPQQTLWTVLGVLAVVLGGIGFYSRHKSNRDNAWAKLAVATSYAYMGQTDNAVGQISRLADEHPSSPASGFGRLLAADLAFDQSKFAEAGESYKKVAETPSDESQRPLALAGLALSQEASGDCKAGSETAQRFIESHQDHFLAPQVQASLLRCASALGDKEKARSTAEKMEFLYPNTYWAEWAKVRKN